MLGTRIVGRCRYLVTAAMVGGTLLAGGSATGATENDTEAALKAVRRLDEIAAQKLEAEVHAAYKEADRLGATDRKAAIDCLKAILGQVEAEPNLPAERRDSMVRMLKVKIRYMEMTVGQKPASTNAPNVAQQRRAEQDRQDAANETIARTLDTIKHLRSDGKLDEARAMADDLARQFPSDPAVVAASRTASVAGNVARAQTLAVDRDRSDVSVQRDFQKSATPSSRDVDFPKDWQERVKNRTRTMPLTEKEKNILKALDSRIVVKFRSESFENAIKFISDQIKQPILIDRIALEESQVKYETPVTMETPANGLAARTLLRRLLADYGLAYVIKDQSIEVTTNLRAKNMMVVRSYFIGDLLNNPSLAAAMGQPQLMVNTPGMPWWLNPSVNQALMAQQATQIMDMIKDSVEPDSWRIGGGSITFSAATMTLVVRQSAEVHGMLGAGLLK